MQRLRWRTATVAAVMALGLVLAAGAPAAAADGWQRTVNVADAEYDNQYAKTCRNAKISLLLLGTGCFQPYGEWIWLKDMAPNSEPVAVDWWWTDKNFGGTRAGIVYWDGGKDSGWTNLNKSFDEEGRFNFRVCEVNLPGRYLVESTCSSPIEVRT